MNLILGFAAIGIYFTIFGILFKDAMDQIRRKHDEFRIIKRQSNTRHKRGKHW